MLAGLDCRTLRNGGDKRVCSIGKMMIHRGKRKKIGSQPFSLHKSHTIFVVSDAILCGELHAPGWKRYRVRYQN
jgi:hypothetical protein